MDYQEWLQRQQCDGKLRSLTPLVRKDDGRVELQAAAGTPFLDFSSNDYLALSRHPALVAASRQAATDHGCGAGASRLMSGDLSIFHELEAEIAVLKGCEDALLFGSGYLANCGIIAALMGRRDVIFSDRLNHASIYDGCRLSRAKIVRFPHNDMNHLEELLKRHRGDGEALLIAESLYSMDGDRCPLADLVTLKKRYNCLLVIDEAHATGLYGENGGGLIQQEGLAGAVDFAMGTFGKALGSYGAYVGLSADMKRYLINRARTFIYSTALPPPVAAASMAALRLVRADAAPRLLLQRRAALFRGELRRQGVACCGDSQIIPVHIGESARAACIADQLRGHGLYATAVRPPTVPEQTARLRFSITLHLNEHDLTRAAYLVAQVLGENEP